MKIFRNSLMLAIVAIAGGLFAMPAQAHHVMDGTLPSTFLQGLLSGIGHPIIGLDHFAFVAGIGLAAVMLKQRFWLPAAFVAATVLGVAVHLFSVDLPLVEPIIALSVLIAGVLLISGTAISFLAWASLFGIAGLFHGYAYGESIIGAEAAPLGAYFLGFGLIQYAIAIAVMLLATKVFDAARSAPSPVTRIGGGIVAGIGLVFVANLILPA